MIDPAGRSVPDVRRIGLGLFDDIFGVARAAIDLGAEHKGGVLSSKEKRIIARVKRLPRSGSTLIDALKRAIGDGLDPLGDALTTLRSREERRFIGSFFTPSELVQPMVRWALRLRPYMVVDPGCGSGRFAVEVVRRNRNMRVVAIDADPFATLVTRANLAVVGARWVSVANEDFLKYKLRRGHARVAFVGNPPFVRHHYMHYRDKLRGAEIAADAGHPSLLTAGLHALFFAHTRVIGKDGDVGCYVSSAEWLDNTSGDIVRKLFLNGLGGSSVTVVDPETFAFAGVKTTAAITRFVLGRESTTRRIAVNVPLEQFAGSQSGVAHRRLDVAVLERSRGWTDLATNPRRMENHGPTIGDLFKVSRGTATGTNAYFALKRDRARECGIEAFCVPTVTSADEIIAANGLLRDSPLLKVVLDLPPTFNRRANPAVDAYLRAGETGLEGTTPPSQSFNASQRRRVWYSVSLSRPPIVATYMARRPPAFAANPDRLGILNIALSLTPRLSLTDEQITLAVQQLNAAGTDLERHAVRYFGNLRKYEPRAVAALPLPDGLQHLFPIPPRVIEE